LPMFTKLSEEKGPALNRYRALYHMRRRRRFENVLIVALIVLVLISIFLRVSGWSPSGDESRLMNNELREGALRADAAEMKTGSIISRPSRLIIPKIGVNAVVELVGENSKGEMGIPSSYQNTAWYMNGALPGEIGSAVINGHLDTRFFDSGVFRNLGSLTVGDVVQIQEENGNFLKFEVVGKESYDSNNAPLDRIFGESGEARLNLITCDGTWDQSVKRYDRRLVVFTRLISN